MARVPAELAAATGAGVFVYSRAGCGKSGPAPPRRPLSFMDEEALDVLPRVLSAIGFQRGILFGHSDGASIATIYAGSVQDHRVRGLVLMAPHFFTEKMGLAEIRRTRDEFAAGALREKLARWHSDVDGAFRSWVEPWLDPDLRHGISPKRWAISGCRSWSCRAPRTQYGTLKQVEAVREECFCPVEVTIVPGARHFALSRRPGGDA